MKAPLYILNGTISVLIYFVNTVLCFIPLFAFSLLKLFPVKPWQRVMSIIVDGIATFWISVNRLNQNIFSRTKFIVKGNINLSPKDWYLVVANHQSWVDILTLQRIFNRRIPFLKFFLKKELIYVPFLGLAWWGLDFPFMQRYSKAVLAKKPHLKGKDIETTKKACEKFEYTPVSVMNFVEGTRLDEKKLTKQDVFKNVLPPRAGGIAFVLSAMGNKLSKLVNVTIHYPKGIPSYWDFISGKVKQIVVDVETIDIKKLFDDGIFNDSYFTNDAQKETFQNWMNELWVMKDAKLEQLKKDY